MIQSIEIKGLNGQNNTIKYEFFTDLNIITGQNGCGKTTLLKILWYINACRFDMLEKEVDFNIITVKINNEIVVVKKIGDEITNIKIGKNVVFDTEKSTLFFLRNNKLARLQNEIELKGTTLFFPTFRRIEGGFGMEDKVVDSISDVSRNLSSVNHKFIASVSTKDIDSFLSTQYAKISKQSIDIQQNTFKNIRSIIKGKIKDPLNRIEELIRLSEESVNKINQPFDVLADTYRLFFHHKGIGFNELVLGDRDFSISSDKLSAGEKQMLSFLCYNAFYKDATIFIDEPELSLHPEWQRKLMPTLLSQNTGNQYMIATHSPMIYSQYPEKEVCLDDNKGE